MAKELNDDGDPLADQPKPSAPAPQAPNRPAEPQSPNPAPSEGPEMKFEETPAPQSRPSGIQPPPPRG